MRTVVTASLHRSGRLAACLFGTVAVVGLAHCGGNDAGPGSSGGAVTDGGSSGLPDAGGSSGAACTPKTCADTANCGTYDDGCGTNLSCAGACTCTANDFEQVCPPRPCETVAGCTNGTCVYAPVTCGTGADQQTCAPVPCTGEECGNVATAPGQDDKIYACGGLVCAAVTAYCDPKGTVTGGVVSYQNVCVDPPQTGCGTCGLGTTSCNGATDRFLCDAVPVPVLENGGTVECDSTTFASSFVYMDVLYTQNNSNGSKTRPWKTYADALLDAQARNARGIVIGGSPVFTAPLEVTSGIGIYGGFGLSPEFTPEPTQRPKWDVPASAVANNVLVGVRAKSVSSGTALFHLQIVTADLVADAGAPQGTPGASNVGVWVEDSNGLRLDDMLITTGKAGDGKPGAAGVDGSPGNPGAFYNVGGPGASCAASVPACNTNPGNGALGGQCGLGGQAVPNLVVYGNGHALNVYDGGRGGTTGNVCVVPGAGEPGVKGEPGAPGGNGAGGPRATLLDSGVAATTGGPGTAAGFGSVGSGGGSSGAYFCGATGIAGQFGGGGGGNGCGGYGAQGGGAGGMALGVAMVGSSHTLLVSGGTITSGSAGTGGDGGNGGFGGEGGPGGPSTPGALGIPSGRGGQGGTGGRGGHGGGGGGGDSFAIACTSADATVSFGASPQLASGAAGLPGASLGNVGAAGTAGTTLTCTVAALPD